MKKNTLITTRFAFLLILLAANTSCINSFVEFPRRSERPKYERKFSETTFDLTTNTGKFSGEVFFKLNAEDFPWLEKTASKARESKEKMNGGFWKIRTFYAGIQPLNNTDLEYQKLFEKLNRWKNAYPDSITPRVAISEAWQSYAGEARGGGYADTVTEEGWRLFRERMGKSEKELLEAKKLNELCPFWYVSMLTIAGNNGWNFEDYEALFQDAVTFEPDFYYFHRQKAMYLLPRYSGRQGDFENFLEQIYREKGAMMYYLTLSHFILNVGDMPYDGRKYSGEKAKEGFNELRQAYGAEKQRLNEFAKFSVRAGDFLTAGEIFNEIGEDWDKEVWRNKKTFDEYRAAVKQAERARKSMDNQN